MGRNGKAGSFCQVPRRPPDCVRPRGPAFSRLTGQGPLVPRGSRCGRSRTRTTRGKKTDRSGPLGDERTEFTPVHERGLGRGPGCALSSPVAVLGTGGRKQSTRAPHRWRDMPGHSASPRPGVPAARPTGEWSVQQEPPPRSSGEWPHLPG